MRRGGLVLLAFFVGACSLGLWAAGPAAGPGGTWIKGSVNPQGVYQIQLITKQAAPSLFTIWAVKVYSEPSHSFLCALVDDGAPGPVVQAIASERPSAMATGALDDTHPLFGLPAPPVTDRTLRIEYVTQKDGAQSLFLLAELHGLNLNQFEMLSEPDSGGHIKHCGWCPPEFCGCVYCQGPAFTLCCPDCTIACEVIVCPP